jgi:L-ascorbate metabolism protein UlaG (beta-lactamase superfamily)
MPLLGERSVDVALLPVWGWGPTLGPGHLDPIEAAEAVALIRPRIAVPVHWGTLTVAGIGPRSPLGGRMRRLLVEPPRQFAAEVVRRALATTVLVTEPGAAVALPSGPQECALMPHSTSRNGASAHTVEPAAEGAA